MVKSNKKKQSTTSTTSTTSKKLRGPLTFLKDGHHRNASGIYNLPYNYFEEIILKKRIRVFFQPIVDIVDQNIHAFEALSRPPKDAPLCEFSPFSVIKEENHTHLDKICLDRITKQITKIQFFDKINRFKTHYFINCLISNIDHFIRLPILTQLRKRIVVEFDINHTFFDFDQFMQKITQLKNDNFNIALDDIGETNVDFKLIKFINPKFIKIDMSVIKDISNNEEQQEKAKEIVSVANQLKSEIIAEGVETKEDLEYAVKIGCRYIQGFLFSKPMEFLPKEKKSIDSLFKKAA